MSSSTPVTLFVSYAHEDDDLREELAKHLKLLQRQGVIEDWYDRLIQAGEEWNQEIQTRLLTANVILLLVSADFLASDYCWDQEVRQAMERHHNGDAVVIPIILRACDWNSAPFGKIQALPRDARPVMSWNDRDEAFLDIARGIRQVSLGIQAKLAQQQRKQEQIQNLRSRLPELMDRDHIHQARDTLRELEKLGWKGVEFEEWREQIGEAILREERAGELLDSAIKASEGEHYEEAIKYLEEAASLSPDHSGIQRIRTAVEKRQHRRAVHAPGQPPDEPEKGREEIQRPADRDTAGKEEAVSSKDRPGKAARSHRPLAPGEGGSSRTVDFHSSEEGQLPSPARRMIAAFRDRPRMQVTGGVLIVFLAVLLFYRAGPATGDQRPVDQQIAEIQSNEAPLGQGSSPPDQANENLSNSNGSVQAVRPSPETESPTQPPVSSPGTEAASPPVRQETVVESADRPPQELSTAAEENSGTDRSSSTGAPDETTSPHSTSEQVVEQASATASDAQEQVDPLNPEWLTTGFTGLETELRQEIGRSLREILVSEPANGRANLYLGMIDLDEGRAEQARGRLVKALSTEELTPREKSVARAHFLELPHSFSVEHLHPSLSGNESGCRGTLSFESELVSFRSSSEEEERISVKIPSVRRAAFEKGTLQIQVQGGRPLTFRFGQGRDIRDVHALLVYGYGFSGH